jgi:hypothetical protein
MELNFFKEESYFWSWDIKKFFKFQKIILIIFKEFKFWYCKLPFFELVKTIIYYYYDFQ